MKTYYGVNISEGIAIGRLLLIENKDDYTQQDRKVSDTKEEVERLDMALGLSGRQIDDIYNRTKKDLGEESAAIFKGQKMIFKDEVYIGRIKELIEVDNKTAECSVTEISNEYIAQFEAFEDEYMKERAIDVRDAKKRILSNLTGNVSSILKCKEPSVIYAKELTPSDTMAFDKNIILGIVLESGTEVSHVAIIARSMGIPVISGVTFEDGINNKDMVIVDAQNAEVLVQADEQTVCEYKEKQRIYIEEKNKLKKYKHMESITSGGKKIEVSANISGTSDLSEVIENGADGIGLFRTEFIFMQKDGKRRLAAPDEEEQFEIYKEILTKMKDRKVVIRTVDIGADKQVEYIRMKDEENPALGLRGIRLCLREKELFKTQLRALMRAAVYGNLHIMFPMIAVADELIAVSRIMDEVEEELKAEKIPYKMPKRGIMVETPAAAIMCEELAPMVDFFSIGTNDLTQYTLAMDRQNSELDIFIKSHNSAIFKLIENIAASAKRYGIWVGICGELATDSKLTKWFIDIGIDELSVVPSKVLGIKKNIIMEGEEI